MTQNGPRIGVAGAGYWGANLVRNCWEMERLAAVCDADLHRLEEVRSKYPGVALFNDYDAMIHSPKVEAVVIAAPAPLHAELALRAFAAGKHVFVEKPLALTVEDARAVVTAARKARRVLFVGHVLLYHPAVVTMLDAVRSGRIGDVRHLRSRRLSWGRLRAHENVWWSFAPHDMALMLEVMGGEPESVTRAQSDFVRPGIADFAYADFRFSGGRSAHVEVSWLDPDKSSRVDVFGSEGTLTLIDSREGARLTLTPCGDRADDGGARELWRGQTQALELPAGEPLRLELEAFCEAVSHGRRVPTDGDEGLAVVRALAMESAPQDPHPVQPFVLEALA